MTFDVTLTSYKRPDLLKAAVLSCLNQGPLLRKIVIVDDGSKDGTGEMVHSLNDRRIVFFERAENGGIAAARRDAFALSDSDWTIKLDSDHELLPGAIQKMAELAQRVAGDVDILGGRYRWDTGTLSPVVVPTGVIDYRGRIEYASRPDSIGMDYLYAISRRVRCLVRYEPLRSSVPDALFQLDLARVGRAAFTGEILALEKSCSEHSWTRGNAQARWARRRQDARDGITAIKLIEKRHGAELRQWGRPMLSGILAAGTLFAVMTGRRALAVRWACQSVALSRTRLAFNSVVLSLLPLRLLARVYLWRG